LPDRADSGMIDDLGLGFILVVDDFADNRELFAATFTEAGYEVEEAGNGEEALEVIARRCPVVVVTDLSMPVMDGWETTRRIKADPATRHIIIIAITGHATTVSMKRAQEAGADAVVAKPCLPSDLMALVRKLTTEL
jgi:two-component system cell cycle response regulator DivK